jgi:hypothetical protein
MKIIVARFLLLFPAIILTTILNVLICSAISNMVLYHLITNGTNKNLSLLISIIVAVGIYSYIVFYSKIRQFIKQTGEMKHE